MTEPVSTVAHPLMKKLAENGDFPDKSAIVVANLEKNFEVTLSLM
ncbi:hypothetical protein FHX06_007151 [Rhizobium sp. BK512]|nr:hypothetical protein [Rhizobium sp. BK512]MBB3565778.1 hypothetical protein [Rhizobium sp. BK512]